MLRGLWVLMLLLVLGGLVASGLADGWSQGHVVFGLGSAALLVLAVWPTKQPAATAGAAGAGRRGQ